MFKWHVDAAISRSSRGRVSDLKTVADGIAFSLRQFSLSAAHSAEDQPSRKTRSATAFAELASSTPRPSRSSSSTPNAPAAKPSTFTARRIVVQGSAGPQQRAPRSVTAPRKPDAVRGSLDARGSAGGRGGFMGGARGRGIGRNMGFSPRGGAGGGGRGSRGRGARGRGDGGRGRGRGRGRGLLSGPRKPKKKPWEEEAEEPFTEEETDYLDRRDGGFTTPYIPDTSLENLARHRPPVISSATGFADFVRYKLAVMTDNVSPQYRFSSQHLMRVDRGYGTLFEDLDQRSIVQEHKDKLDEERAAARGEPYVREEFGQLAADKRKDIMLQWVAGHYEAPSKITLGDPLSYVRNYAKRNETWLSQDAQRFEAKVASFGLRK